MGNWNGHVGHVHMFSPVLSDCITVTRLAQLGQNSIAGDAPWWSAQLCGTKKFALSSESRDPRYMGTSTD